jgi:transposase
LTAAVRRRDVGVVEVLRTDRRDRRLRGKSDTLDAKNAARAGVSGQASAVPKTNDGTVEMLRQIKIAKDTAVKARTAAMISIKAVLITPAPELREELQPLSKMKLITRSAARGTVYQDRDRCG